MNIIKKYLASNTVLLFLIAIIYFISPLLSAFFAIFYIWKRTSWSKKIKAFTSVGLVLLLLLPLASAYGIFPIRPLKVAGVAMEPELKRDAYILARTYYPELDSLKRGEIVIHKFPTNKNYSTVRRVIGLPNENILIKEGKVFVNNKPIDESDYLSNVETIGGKFLQENKLVNIPSDSYVVLSDNRNQIDDSREWGFVKKDEIENKYLFCYYNC